MNLRSLLAGPFFVVVGAWLWFDVAGLRDLPELTSIGRILISFCLVLVPGLLAIERWPDTKLLNGLCGRSAVAFALSPLIVGVLAAPILWSGGDLDLAFRGLLITELAACVYCARARSFRVDRNTRRELPVLFAAVALAGWLAAQYRAGSMVWLQPHGLLHGAIAQSIAQTGLPVQHPFLAGEPLGYYWLPHLLQALWSHGAGVDMLTAGKLHTVTCALAAVIVAFLLGRNAARGHLGPRRRLVVLFAVLGVSIGLNSLGPVLVRLAQALAVAMPPLPLPWRALVAGYDPRVASALDNWSASGSRWFAECAGWLAVLAADQRSRRPAAFFLASLLGLVAFLANPIVGASLWVAAALCGVRRGRTRWAFWAAHAVAFLAGLGYFVFTCLGEGQEALVHATLNSWWNLLGPHLWFVVVMIVVAVWTRGRDVAGAVGRRWALVVLGWLAALSWFVDLPLSDQYLFVRLMAVPLAVGTAGGLARLCVHRTTPRIGARGIATGVLSIAALLPAPVLSVMWIRHLSRSSAPVQRVDAGLVWSRGASSDGTLARGIDLDLDRELGLALECLRCEVRVEDAVVCDSGIEFIGLDKAQGSPLPALTGCRMFVDATTNYLSRPAELVGQRQALVRSWLAGQPAMPAEVKSFLATRRLFFLVRREHSQNLREAFPNAALRPRYSGARLDLFCREADS